MSNEKTKAQIDVLQHLEAAAKVAGRAKDPIVRLAAAELEVELKERRQKLERSLSEPELGLAEIGHGHHA